MTGCFLGGPHTPIAIGIASQQLFTNQIPAKGAKIIVEIRKNQIDLALGVEAIEIKGLDDGFQNNALLFPLGRDGFQFIHGT